MKYSKDGRCGFDEKWHSFVLDGKKRLRSWSKLIKQFREEVDSDLLAENYAVKHGLKKEYVLAMWEAKATASKNTGISVHSFIDNFIQTGEVLLTNTEPKEKGALSFIEDMLFTRRLVAVESEMIAYNEEYKCATLIDCIVRDGNGRHYIIDWKTNTEIKQKNYGKYLKTPFNLLQDHDLMQYQLQVNFGKTLCTDYNIDGMYLVHITETGYKMIPVPDMKLNLAALCSNG